MINRVALQYGGAVHLVSALSQRWGDDEEMLNRVHRCMTDYVVTSARHLVVERTSGGGYSFFEDEPPSVNVKPEKEVLISKDLNRGVWFRAACSGMYYPVEGGERAASAAGAVQAVLVNGQRFTLDEQPKLKQLLARLHQQADMTHGLRQRGILEARDLVKDALEYKPDPEVD